MEVTIQMAVTAVIRVAVTAVTRVAVRAVTQEAVAAVILVAVVEATPAVAEAAIRVAVEAATLVVVVEVTLVMLVVVEAVGTLPTISTTKRVQVVATDKPHLSKIPHQLLTEEHNGQIVEISSLPRLNNPRGGLLVMHKTNRGEQTMPPIEQLRTEPVSYVNSRDTGLLIARPERRNSQ